MKKNLFFGLAIILLVAISLLTACQPTTPTTPTTTSPTAQPTSTQPITLKFSNAMAPNGEVDKACQYYIDLVQKNSNGRVKFDYFPGGTIAGHMESLSLLGSGGIDVACYMHFLPPDKVILHNITPSGLPGDLKFALDFGQKIEFDVPETASPLAKEWAGQGVKLLSYLSGAPTYMVSKTVFKSIDELKGKKMGTSHSSAGLVWAEKGVVAVVLQPPDMYEALSRGVIDFIGFSLAGVMDYRWYEVSKCAMFDGSSLYMTPIMVNLKMWNSLPPDIQKAFTDALEPTRQYSLELGNKMIENALKAFKDNGLVYGALPEAESIWMWNKLSEVNNKEMMGLAEKLGKAEDAKIVLAASKKLLDQMLAK